MIEELFSVGDAIHGDAKHTLLTAFKEWRPWLNMLEEDIITLEVRLARDSRKKTASRISF